MTAQTLLASLCQPGSQPWQDGVHLRLAPAAQAGATASPRNASLHRKRGDGQIVARSWPEHVAGNQARNDVPFDEPSDVGFTKSSHEPVFKQTL